MKDILAKFWADVYIQSLNSGYSHHNAVDSADRALVEFKMRFN